MSRERLRIGVLVVVGIGVSLALIPGLGLAYMIFVGLVLAVVSLGFFITPGTRRLGQWLLGLGGVMLAAATIHVALLKADVGWPQDKAVSAAAVAAHEEAHLQYPGSSVVEPVAEAESRGGWIGEVYVHSAKAGAWLKAPPDVAEDQIRDFYLQELTRRGWEPCQQPYFRRMQLCRGQREVVEVGLTNPDSDKAGEGPGLAYYVFYYLTPKDCPRQLSCPGDDW